MSSEIGADNQSFANSTRSNISQYSKSEKDDKNSSWFKSLKRNLSSKKNWGKLAKSGGNISAESNAGGEAGGSRRIKSEWDICDDDEGEQRPGVTDYDNLGVVSGLDLAHRKHRARQPIRGIYIRQTRTT